MYFDFRTVVISFVAGGGPTDQFHALMGDTRRVAILFNPANTGPIFIGVKEMALAEDSIWMCDSLTPTMLLYKDIGDIVKTDFWVFSAANFSHVTITEILLLEGR